ncbi:MAG: M15 family metallopeptidase [Candidatus Nanopelagicales bacterium]|jgi:peptidoglycan L-alanyl-D-glutamate endopeptidase CwlK
MPKFSDKSAARLATCHPDIQAVLNEVIKYRDCTILEGVRSIETQQHYVETGRSQTMNSKHLQQDDGYSHAVDVAKWPVDWEDLKAFALFAGYFLGTAEQMRLDGRITHRFRWGGDWDSDGATTDHSFFDGPHFELVK